MGNSCACLFNEDAKAQEYKRESQMVEKKGLEARMAGSQKQSQNAATVTTGYNPQGQYSSMNQSGELDSANTSIASFQPKQKADSIKGANSKERSGSKSRESSSSPNRNQGSVSQRGTFKTLNLEIQIPKDDYKEPVPPKKEVSVQPPPKQQVPQQQQQQLQQQQPVKQQEIQQQQQQQQQQKQQQEKVIVEQKPVVQMQEVPHQKQEVTQQKQLPLVEPVKQQQQQQYKEEPITSLDDVRKQGERNMTVKNTNAKGKNQQQLEFEFAGGSSGIIGERTSAYAQNIGGQSSPSNQSEVQRVDMFSPSNQSSGTQMVRGNEDNESVVSYGTDINRVDGGDSILSRGSGGGSMVRRVPQGSMSQRSQYTDTSMVRVDATGADEEEDEEFEDQNYARDFLSPSNLEEQNRNSKRPVSTTVGNKKDYQFSNRNQSQKQTNDGGEENQSERERQGSEYDDTNRPVRVIDEDSEFGFDGGEDGNDINQRLAENLNRYDNAASMGDMDRGSSFRKFNNKFGQNKGGAAGAGGAQRERIDTVASGMNGELMQQNLDDFDNESDRGASYFNKQLGQGFLNQDALSDDDDDEDGRGQKSKAVSGKMNNKYNDY